MKKFFLLASSNMRKSKSQIITIVALVLIASMFLSIWLLLTTDYSKNYEKRNQELSSEQSLISFSSQDDEFKEICSSALNENKDVLDFVIVDTISSEATIEYANAKINCYTSFMSLSDAKLKKLGKYKFLSESVDFKENMAYLPYLFHTGGGYDIGDSFEIELGTDKFPFVIGGFFENMMAGSMNASVFSIILHDKTIETMHKDSEYNSINISVKLKSGVNDEKFTSAFVEKVTENRLVPYYSTWGTINEQGRTFISEIVSSIIAIVAFLIILIVLIVISFNISSKVEEDMKNLGVLKGIGYQSSQIVGSIVLQFAFIALVSGVVGIAISYAVIPLIADLLIAQTGVVWEYGFSAMSAVICLALIGGVASIISFLSANKIKKVTPMIALRDGIETHNFKKNSLPLEKTKLGINLALGAKALSKNKKQNIAVVIILACLTFVGVFAGALYFNIALDPEMFINTITGESADAMVVTTAENAEEVLTSLESKEGVQKAYLYQNNAVYVNDTNIMCYIAEDFSQVNNKLVCYEGRLPNHDNEVAIGGVFARDNSLKIGDTVKLKFNKPEQEFLITGLTQSSNYMGQDCMMTASGFERIGDLLYKTYGINVKDGVDVDKFISEIEVELSGKILSTSNIKAAEAGSSQGYIDMMSIIAIAAIVIILLVIVLVLYLMVKAFVLKKRKEMGILKAQGFTTKQLVLQTIFSFMPVVGLGVVLGIILGIFFTNPIFTILLSGVGIMKSMFEISPAVLVAVGLGVMIFSTCVTYLVSQRIRKIEVQKLLTNS